MKWLWSGRQRQQRAEFSAHNPIVELLAEAERSASTTVSRRDALSVPAVRRGRNMLCSIATLPLEQLKPDNTVEDSALLRQIDPDVPNVVTLAQTVEDLLFDGLSWWEVTATDFDGYPVSARHLDVSAVTLQPPGGTRSPAPLPSGHDPRRAVVWVDGRAVGADRIIRFDSPNPAVLNHAGREIRRAIALDKSAIMYAQDPRPADYFTPTDGAEEIGDTEVGVILAKWRSARRQKSTGWVPRSMTYHEVNATSPRDLQLAELSKQANLDIANALGIDPEDLGISTTSRTYANDVDRRRNKLNDVLAPYMRALTDRLSMGDVTRRGHTVRLNTTEYLMPNPTERWANYTSAKALEAITVEEIRVKEGEPPMPPPPPPPPPPPGLVAAVPGTDEPAEEEADAMTASTIPAAVTFDGPSEFTMDLPVVEFTVDRENRIIEGLAVPYGQYGTKGGVTFRFDTGSLKWAPGSPGRVKLVFPRHGESIGKAIELRDTPAGLLSRFKIGRGAEGDRALSLAEDGVYDGLSIGVDFDARADAVPDPNNRGAMLVRRADLRHVALTDEPVFDNARVTRVAASRTAEEGSVPDNQATTTEPPAEEAESTGLELSQDQLTALLSRPGAINAIVSTQQAAAEPEAPAGALTLSADQVDGLIQSGQLGSLLGLPGVGAPARPPVDEGPTPVDPTRLGLSRVTEPEPYRFDRDGNLMPGTHDFSSDLVAVGRDRDKAAEDRAMAFIRAQFDVQTTDVNELNPNIQRPDMYVDQLDFEYPLWASINRGALSSVTPFVVPKFSSSSGLVADHTETTEPTSGTFVTTSQTITPTALSGKAEITRETWDQGGNPQVSALVWRQMVREWNEDLESAAATFLNTLTAATDITITTAAADDALASEWFAAMASLQFVRGGHRFSMFGVHIDLYKAFVDAVDTTGRALFPILNPQNANGTASPRFGRLDLAGVTGVPSWALGTTGTAAANSWLFNPEDVHGWASPPQRLQFETRIEAIEIGIWGYKAFANTRIDGVRQVIYDPSTDA